MPDPAAGDDGASDGEAAKLRVAWSAEEGDFVIHYPRSADGRLVHGALMAKRCRRDASSPLGVAFDPSFVDELKARG